MVLDVLGMQSHPPAGSEETARRAVLALGLLQKLYHDLAFAHIITGVAGGLSMAVFQSGLQVWSFALCPANDSWPVICSMLWELPRSTVAE